MILFIYAEYKMKFKSHTECVYRAPSSEYKIHYRRANIYFNQINTKKNIDKKRKIR